MSRFQEYLEASKPDIVTKDRRSCRIVLTKRDPKFEDAISKKTNITGYHHGDTKNGFAYKFNNDYDWEQALKLLGAL